MKRRDFIKKSIAATVASAATFSMGKWNIVHASKGVAGLPYDMVAIKNSDPVTMFDQAIAELGGIGQFVKQGQTVIVKPNIGWDAKPERAANSNPELVGRIVKHCVEAGAKKVVVFDKTCDEWTRCYKNSGIENAVKANGGQMMAGNSENNYRPVKVPNGINLKQAKVHEAILDSDVFINVPVLKNHGGAQMSLTMKNLMGIVWDRRYFHAHDLHQCIADFATFRKPDLNVIDGYRVMKRNGPRGVSVDDVATMKYQLLSTDMVASDTAACKIFGMQVEKVKHIALAEKLGVGTSNLESLNIKRISI